MPDSSIADLPVSATLPLAGDELIPIVQGGETKRVAVESLLSSSGLEAPESLYVSSSGSDSNAGTSSSAPLATLAAARQRIGARDGNVIINLLSAGLYVADGWDRPRSGRGQVIIQAPTAVRQVVHGSIEVTAFADNVDGDYTVQVVTVDAALEPGSLRGMIYYSAAANADPNLEEEMNTASMIRAVIVDNTEDTIIVGQGMSPPAVTDLISIGYPTARVGGRDYRHILGGSSLNFADVFTLRHVEIDADGISSSISTLEGAWNFQEVTLQPYREHNLLRCDLGSYTNAIGARYYYDPETPEVPPVDSLSTYLNLQHCRGVLGGYLGNLRMGYCSAGSLYAYGSYFQITGSCRQIASLEYCSLDTNTQFMNVLDYASVGPNAQLSRLGTRLRPYYAFPTAPPTSAGYLPVTSDDTGELAWQGNAHALIDQIVADTYAPDDDLVTVSTIPIFVGVTAQYVLSWSLEASSDSGANPATIEFELVDEDDVRVAASKTLRYSATTSQVVPVNYTMSVQLFAGVVYRMRSVGPGNQTIIDDAGIIPSLSITRA